MNDNPSCQHYRVNNSTARCEVCNEQMVTMNWEAETVLSAPNAAPCTDPAHLAAIAASEDFECHHPYIPDLAHEREVVIGYTVTYRCARCENNGTVITSRDIMWDCGHSHHGDRLPPGATIELRQESAR